MVRIDSKFREHPEFTILGFGWLLGLAAGERNVWIACSYSEAIHVTLVLDRKSGE